MRAPTRLIDRLTLSEGELTAAVGELEFPASARQAAFAVWIFASEGIEAHGCPEVVVALARPDGRPAYPRFPFAVLKAAYDSATAGTPLQPGSWIEFSEPQSPVAGAIITSHPVSDRRLRAEGVAYRDPFPLLAIPLLADELMAADVFGPARVLARCGEHARHYPYPWWFDGRSAPVLDLAGDAEKTLLHRMPRQPVPFAEVMLTASHLEIIVPEDRCGELRDMLADAPQAAALLPRLSHMADTLLYWRAGQDQPRAIVDAAGTQGPLKLGGELSAGGNFLAFVRGRERSEAVFLEDGFALSFPDALWEQFVTSVGACRPMRWRTEGVDIHEASLTFTSKVHWSPLDGEFVSEGAFRTTVPKRSEPGPHAFLRNFDVEKIVLLVSTHEIEEADAVDAILHMIEEASAILDDGLEGMPTTWEQMVVDIRLGRDHIYIVLAVREMGNISQPELQRLVDRLNGIPAPAVDHDELRFQVWLRPPVS